MSLIRHRDCPFCKHRDIRAHHRGHPTAGEWVIECHSCPCELTGFATQADAWKAWDQRADDELLELLRMVHVLRAYSWTCANVPNPAREDPLYPQEGIGEDRGKIWREISRFLDDHTYIPTGTV
jgi:hypothetical protein